MGSYEIRSYSAADNFPIKVLQHYDLIQSIIVDGIVPPIHIQFIPTNKCNLSCGFCSCADDDRLKEISLSDAIKIITKLVELGAEAVTITGGGEPLLHPNIDDIMNLFYGSGIEIGLVTNGTRLYNFNSVDKLTWCRISHSDDRNFEDYYKDLLQEVVKNNPTVDWAFSYVLTDKPNYENLIKIIKFSNKNEFTHVRIVSDIFNPRELASVKEILEENVICENVIFQDRANPTKGSDCYICYLKPVIGADGLVYACCGVQYAIKGKGRSMPEELCLGNIDVFSKILETSSIPFDGSICDVCYYSKYNSLIKNLLVQVDHRNFV